MPKAARLGDPIGHTPPGGGPQGGGGGDVTGKIIGPCSGNVFTNGIKAARAHVDKTVCSKHDKAPPPIATGSATVFINGLPAARVSDKIACGAFIIDGSSNVFIGDSGAQTDTVMPEGVMAPGLEAVMQMAEISATASYGSASAARVTAQRTNRIRTAAPPKPPPPQLKGEDSYKTGNAFNVRGDFDNGRHPAVIGEPTERMVVFDKRHPAEPALVYPVTVDGHTVEVTVSKNPAKQKKGMTVPGVEAIAKSLGALEHEQLVRTNTILISPYPYIGDFPAVGKKKGSQRAAGALNGDVDYYPLPDEFLGNQNSMDSLMIHETAHFIHQERWAAAPEEEEEWANAKRSDPGRPSVYSANSEAEDFAESVIMYRISKGTPEEARARELFPERYRILDEVLRPEPRD